MEKPQYGTVPAVEDYRSVVLQRAVFQGVASMGLPAFTIHSIVRYSGRALKNARNTMVRTYGPIGVCFSFLTPPFLFFHFLSLLIQLGGYQKQTLLLNYIFSIARPSSSSLPPLYLRQASRARRRMELPQSL